MPLAAKTVAFYVFRTIQTAEKILKLGTASVTTYLQVHLLAVRAPREAGLSRPKHKAATPAVRSARNAEWLVPKMDSRREDGHVVTLT